jgi:hypothetical protein
VTTEHGTRVFIDLDDWIFFRRPSPRAGSEPNRTPWDGPGAGSDTARTNGGKGRGPVQVRSRLASGSVTDWAKAIA